jgi:hypothetical protein
MTNWVRLDEKSKLSDSVFLIFAIIALIFLRTDIPEITRLDNILGEDPEFTILVIIAGSALVIMLLHYVKRSEHGVTPPATTSPTEVKWRENTGNRIRETKGIVALISFLIAGVFMGYNALYLAFAVYVCMRLAQYLFLNPKRETLKDALAIIMILVLLVVVIVWVAVDILFPEGTVLFVIFYILLFVYLFWGGGLDSRF